MTKEPKPQALFWFQADAVIVASSSAEAWKVVAKTAKSEYEGHSFKGIFNSGGMTIVPDGGHLIEPVEMTQEVEDALCALYIKTVMEHGEELAKEERADPVYTMMLGFALARNLRVKDARKVAQRLYRGKTEHQQR